MAKFYGTTGVDRFVGGSADDFFHFTRGTMKATDKVDGGGGKNMLALTNDAKTVWSVSSDSWPVSSKIAGLILSTKSVSSADAFGFSLTLDDAVFKTNKVSRFAIDASKIGTDGSSLKLNAASVTSVSFDITGSTDRSKNYDDRALDNLKTGNGNDRFTYYANTLINDTIDGGTGTDTLVLSGAGGTITKTGKTTTDPNGVSYVKNIKNIEKIVVTKLVSGQSRTIDFGYNGDYKGRDTINITTNRNYGTDKASAAIDGKLIVDGIGLSSKYSKLNATGGNAGDLLFGGAADDRLSGGKGNDVLVGGYGNDWLSGGAGNDLLLNSPFLYEGNYELNGVASGTRGKTTMYGGEGNDTFHLAMAYQSKINAEIVGGTGTDTLRFSNYKQTAGMIDSGKISGIEIVDFNSANIDFDVSQNFLRNNHDETGRLRIQNLAESSYATISVDASKVTDTKYSVYIAIKAPGEMNLIGSAGNDVFDFSRLEKTAFYDGLTENDIIVGGSGIDTIIVAEGHETVLGQSISGVETLKVANVSGKDVETRVTVNMKQAITIDASKLTANDALVIGSSTAVNATASLSIIGGKGDDIILGGQANDQLRGGDGDDSLNGNAGADRLTGGNGADHFIIQRFESPARTSKCDFITDFSRAQGDKIELSFDEFTTLQLIGSNAFHGVAGEIRSFSSGGDTYIELDADGDGIADLGIGFSGTINLTQSDFIL